MSIVGVDVGGTFTDVYVFEEDGRTLSAKSPTTADAVTGVIDAMSKVASFSDVDSLAFGSTIATNALVERKLAKAALVTTKGFRDVLDIRRLWRRDLFGHRWNRPEAMIPRRHRLEVPGRIDWRGEEVERLDEAAFDAVIDHLRRHEIEAVAVSLLFSYVNPVHEQRTAEILQDAIPELDIVLSSEVNPERNEYERTSTTAIAAALSPVIDRALGAAEDRLLKAGLPNPPRVMKSNGGVMSIAAAREKPVELVKSGPAGGASAGTYLAEKFGCPDLILIDIGGTTADASLIVDGHAVRATHDMLEWDIPLRVPVVDIRSVGAGGGSIAHLDAAGGLKVGPKSAGATPGPVAFGKGGTEPTVTDAAIVSGLIDPEYFLGGTMELDLDGANSALEPIAETLGYRTSQSAAAIMHVATIEMATLIREITVDRGLDPRDFSLVAFGGAGPLFVGMLLEELDMRRGFVPVGASTLSAMGGAFADVTFDYVRSEIGIVEESGASELAEAFDELLERAQVDIEREGLEQVEILNTIDLRYQGQWHPIEMSLDPGERLVDVAARFEKEHERLWGHLRPEDPIEYTAIRTRVVSAVNKPELPAPAAGEPATAKATRQVDFFGFGETEVGIFDRDDLTRGSGIQGPLIVEEEQTTTVVLPDQTLSVGNHGEMVVER